MDRSGHSRPSTGSNEGMNTDLLVRSINYHGQQLTGFLQEKPVFRNLDLGALDYHLYHQRSKELRMEDRGRRMLLHRFISQGVGGLFDARPQLPPPPAQVPPSVISDGNGTDLTSVLPPMETFLMVDKEDRTRHFFETISEGDVLFARVAAKNNSGLMLTVLAFAGPTSKSRYVDDVKIRCFCPSAEMVPAEDPVDPNRNYEFNDYAYVVVLEVKKDAQRLLVGMKKESVCEQLRDKVKLGLSTAVDLPPAYEIAKEALESEDIGYEDFLKRNSGFTNPTNVSQLAAELGMSTRVDSLFDSMRRGCPEAEMAASIRKKQSASWAFGHVASGIRHFKSGNNMEAFQCLNQALKIDEENVEGLVARGALFANNGSLEKAVVDFEMALKHNPTHRNATKYHSETLVAVARRLESEKKVEEAIKTYIKILHRVPDHKEASESLRNLRSVTGNFSGLDPSKPWETREKLRFSLSGVEEDKKGKKQKKKRKRSGSSSGSSSSGSSSGWSSDSRGKKRRSKKGQKEKKRRSGSRSSRDQTTDQAQPRALSPFSQKMQLQQQQQQPFGVAQGMNLPAEYSRGGSLERPVSAAGSNVLPPGEDALPFTPPKKETMDSNQEQMPDLSKPPPSFPAPVSTYEYNPVFPPAQQAQSVSESTYDQAVREFLEKTTGRPPPSSMFDTRIRSRDMDKDRDRERDRDREKERPRRGARESRRRSPTPTPRNREQRRSFSETTKAPVVAKTPPEKEEPVPDSTSSKKSVRKKSRRRSSSSSSSSSFSSSSEEDEKAKKKKKEKSVGTGKKVASSKAAKKKVKKKKDPVTDAATKEEMKKKAKMIAELASMGVNTDMEEFAAKLAGYMKGSKDKGLYCSFGFLIQDNF